MSHPIQSKDKWITRSQNQSATEQQDYGDFGPETYQEFFDVKNLRGAGRLQGAHGGKWGGKAADLQKPGRDGGGTAGGVAIVS